LAWSGDTTVQLWDAATGNFIQQLDDHGAPVTLLDFSPDGKTLAVGTATTIYLWEVATGQRRLVLTEPGNQLTSFGFSPDGRTLVSAQANLTVLLWDRFGAALASQPQPGPFAEARRDALWAELGCADAARAYRTIAVLVASPQQAASLLSERLAAVTADGSALSAGEQLRLLRTIEVLEHLGTRESENLLRKLTEGANDRLRKEAQPALDRLARRGDPAP
jgi:hypothetical protein